MILIVSLFFQDCDMESQYRRFANFCWRMGGCSCPSHPEYVIFYSCGSHCHLISRICACKDLTTVRSSPCSHVRDAILMRAQLKQIKTVFDPLVNSCVPTKTHNGLVNAMAVLVADMVLLLAMLIGLLRHANRCSTGLWKLLYQQASSNRSSSHDSDADFLQCIIWIALAAFAEIPSVVSAFLPF